MDQTGMKRLGTCVVAVHDGRVLIGNNIRKGGWEFAGGKNQQDEAMADTAVREFCEETGVQLQPRDLIFLGYEDRDCGWLCFVFAAKFEERPEVRVCEPDACLGWKWVSLEDLRAEKDLTTAAALVVHKFDAEIARLMGQSGTAVNATELS